MITDDLKAAEEPCRTVETQAAFPLFRRRVLIFGSGRLARDVAESLVHNKKWTAEVVGFLSDDSALVGQPLMGRKVLGIYDQLFQVVEQYKVRTIAVCVEDRRATLPMKTLLDFKAMGFDVVDGHALYEDTLGRMSIDLLRPSALIFSAGFRRRAVAMGLKRLVDLLIAVIGLVLLSPIFVVVALCIKLDSPGPVFYRQMRVGLRGQPYMIWKFRSMFQDAEKSGPRWAEAKDARVSRVGWWIRKTRVDELPQFINVLKGEMGMVGPRPERPVFVQDLRTKIPYYDLRHTVRPGVTGWAQTRFRYGASEADSHTKLQYDLYYVKNMSLVLDLRILLETIRVVMFGEGAR